MDILKIMQIYDLKSPKNSAAGALFNSPHSGDIYPDYFWETIAVSRQTLDFSSDKKVDYLIENIPNAAKLPIFCNKISRSYIDTNRAIGEFNPKMVKRFSLQNSDILKNIKFTTKTQYGFGVIPEKTFNGDFIHLDLLSLEEVHLRLKEYYIPIHDVLEQKLRAIHQEFGYSLLIDCHSMPSVKFMKYHHLISPDESPPEYDIVLGNNYDKSCPEGLTYFIKEYFEGSDLRVSLNTPYAGGFNTVNYASSQDQKHSIQIEINRQLYLNEIKQELLPNARHIQELMTKFALKIASYLQNHY
jgi:N-formylglutamate amidohydrolase